jgi:hypothetical protein
LHKSPANGHVVLPAWRDFDASRVRDGSILGLAGIRGHVRHLATQRGTCSRPSMATTCSESSCKPRFGVARVGAKLTTSFAREVVVHVHGSPMAARPSQRTLARPCELVTYSRRTRSPRRAVPPLTTDA